MIFLCQTKPNLMLKSGKTTVSYDKKWPKTFFLQCFEVFTPLPSISMAIGSTYNWRFQKGIFEILILAQDRCVTFINLVVNTGVYPFNIILKLRLQWDPVQWEKNIRSCDQWGPMEYFPNHEILSQPLRTNIWIYLIGCLVRWLRSTANPIG